MKTYLANKFRRLKLIWKLRPRRIGPLVRTYSWTDPDGQKRSIRELPPQATIHAYGAEFPWNGVWYRTGFNIEMTLP